MMIASFWDFFLSNYVTLLSTKSTLIFHNLKQFLTTSPSSFWTSYMEAPFHNSPPPRNYQQAWGKNRGTSCPVLLLIGRANHPFHL